MLKYNIWHVPRVRYGKLYYIMTAAGECHHSARVIKIAALDMYTHTHTRTYSSIALKARSSSDPVYLHTTPSELGAVLYIDVRHGTSIKYYTSII